MDEAHDNNSRGRPLRTTRSADSGMTAHAASDGPLQQASWSVLLLEDDSQLAQSVRALLETEGFAVQCVPSGAEGLRALLAREFHVILCDMVMPNLPGDLFYLAVKRVRPQLCERFIFTSGHVENKKIDKFIQNVRGLVVWKPFRLSELLEAIRQVLGRQQPDLADCAAAACI